MTPATISAGTCDAFMGHSPSNREPPAILVGFRRAHPGRFRYLAEVEALRQSTSAAAAGAAAIFLQYARQAVCVCDRNIPIRPPHLPVTRDGQSPSPMRFSKSPGMISFSALKSARALRLTLSVGTEMTTSVAWRSAKPMPALDGVPEPPNRSCRWKRVARHSLPRIAAALSSAGKWLICNQEVGVSRSTSQPFPHFHSLRCRKSNAIAPKAANNVFYRSYRTDPVTGTRAIEQAIRKNPDGDHLDNRNARSRLLKVGYDFFSQTLLIIDFACGEVFSSDSGEKSGSLAQDQQNDFFNFLTTSPTFCSLPSWRLRLHSTACDLAAFLLAPQQAPFW